LERLDLPEIRFIEELPEFLQVILKTAIDFEVTRILIIRSGFPPILKETIPLYLNDAAFIRMNEPNPGKWWHVSKFTFAQLLSGRTLNNRSEKGDLLTTGILRLEAVPELAKVGG
jgi:hypothetical protein